MNSTINIPIEMCNSVVKNNLENPFQLFVLFKLSYPSGKITWDRPAMLFASFILKCHPKTASNNFKRLEALGWLCFDEKFNFWRLKAFEKIREENDWKQRRAVPFDYLTIYQIRAVLGAVLFTQLYINFCRKHYKNRSNVLIKDSASKPSVLVFKNPPWAAVSIQGIQKVFKISKSKVLRLKNQAIEQKLIKIKKQYKKIRPEVAYAHKTGLKYNDEPLNIVFRKGNYFIQEIDLISPNFLFKRRKKSGAL